MQILSQWWWLVAIVAAAALIYLGFILVVRRSWEAERRANESIRDALRRRRMRNRGADDSGPNHRDLS